MKNYFTTLFCIFTFAITNSYATTHAVPSQFSTIQAALNACAASDTVWVSPGTYYEHIVWPQVKKIKLLSTGNKGNTAIDGSKSGRVITMDMPDDAIIDNKTQIKGFTIQHGQLDLSASLPVGKGAGIYCFNASPKFVNCNINKNHIVLGADNPVLTGYGAGVYAENAKALLFENCLFKSNRSKLISNMYGSALCGIFSDITLNHCEITGNKTNSGENLPTGVIYCDGGGTLNDEAHRGIHFDQCKITYNEIHNNSDIFPAGTICAVNNSNVVIVNTLITDNIHFGASELYAKGNVLYLNASGADLYFVTIANNDGIVDGRTGKCIYAVNTTGCTVQNSILWNNKSSPEIFVESGSTIDVTYSDVKGGYPGTGNISLKPEFVTNNSDDKHLLPISPCAGAGIASGLGSSIDLENNPRPIPSNTNPDMGCYEVDQTLKLASEINMTAQLSVYPNPSDGNSTLQYTVQHAGFVQIDLLNVNGQVLKTLVAAFQNAGENQLQVSLVEEHAGIYFLQVKVDGSQTGIFKYIRN
ncbi:MAG: T9SS type A sorting domain-containing protein [Chitinophagales bacterium]